MPSKVTDFPSDKPVAGAPVSLDPAPDLIDLRVGGDTQSLEMVPAEGDDVLPSLKVGPLAATGIGHIEALRLLLDGSPYSLAIEGDVRTFEAVAGGSIRVAGGTLGDVAEQLATSGGFFLSVRGNKVVVSATKRFVIEVPHVLDETAATGLEGTLRRFGARDIFLDQASNTLTFEASRTSWVSIDRYLSHLRRNKPMLVYEVEVYQVELADGMQTGVGFTSIAKNLKADPKDWAITRAGEGVGSAALSLVTKNLTMTALVDLLQTQGTVSSLARPRVAMLSGASSKFRVGSTTAYVSKIARSQNTQGSSDSTVTSSSETAEVKTGFELSMRGSYQEGTVYTNLEMTISELVRFNDFEAFGTKLRLPDTTEKEVKTMVRARPGDMILLGGLGSTKQTDDRSGGSTGLSKNTSAKRSEIIVAMRPRVVRFVTSKEAQ